MSRPTHYPEHLTFRVPAAVAETVANAAREQHSNPADFCRRLILAGLRAEGIKVPPLEPASGA